jgi:hypothetical protein
MDASMDFPQRSWSLAFCLLLLMSPFGNSQETGATTFGSCRAVDVDTNFQLVSGPGDEFTVVFDMRNITGRACILDRGSYGANGSPTVPDRTEPGGKVFILTPDSNNRVWGNGRVAEQGVAVLEPGNSAYLAIRWKTKPTQQNDPCIQPIAVNWPARIVAPALLKPVCSEIEVSPFSFGILPTSTKLKGRSPQILALTAKQGTLRSTFYEGEGVVLHVFVHTDHAASSLGNSTHPTVYLRQRFPDGTTEFRATFPLPPKGCEPGDPHAVVLAAPILEEIDWKKGFDLDPDFCGSVILPKRQGDYSFQVFKTIGPSNIATAIRFVYSNVLHVQFENTSPPAQLGTVR